MTNLRDLTIVSVAAVLLVVGGWYALEGSEKEAESDPTRPAAARPAPEARPSPLIAAEQAKALAAAEAEVEALWEERRQRLEARIARELAALKAEEERMAAARREAEREREAAREARERAEAEEQRLAKERAAAAAQAQRTVAPQPPAQRAEPNEPEAPALRPARLIGETEPEYPKEALKHGIEGVVTLRATIRLNGKARDIEIITGNPVLAKAAKKAVKNWRYEPARLENRPVETKETIQVTFRMSGAVGVARRGEHGLIPALSG